MSENVPAAAEFLFFFGVAQLYPERSRRVAAPEPPGSFV
jgi:hypothetical protein